MLGRGRGRTRTAPPREDDRFRAVVDAAPLGMHFYRLEADGRLVFTGANPAADRILRVENATFVGKTIEEAFPALVATEAPARYRAVARDGIPWHAELVDYREGRITGAFEVHAFRTAPGEMAAVFRDRTPEREAERRLVESEAHYRSLVRSLPVVQWTIDRNGVFTLSEGLGLAALGLRPGEVVGRNVADVYRDNPGVLEAYRRALSGEAFQVEHVLGPFIYESRWGPIRDAEGGVVGVAGVAIDVSERHQLAERVQRAQKLETVGRLAGGIAHDFNNLLTVVLSAAEALREEAVAGKPAGLEEVDEIRDAGQRARALVRQLLAFGRKQTFAPEPTDLSEIVRGREQMLRRLLGPGVELVIDAPAALWPVLCDRGHVDQVLLNLAVNARDAMPEGGKLTIATRNAAGAEGVAGEVVRLVIRDTGTGMSPHVKAHLFEPFFTTKPTGQGTGLGLATVYGLVSQNGGSIRVESELGKGTALEISFPRCAQPVASPPAEGRHASVGGSETVLVVDDEAPVREVMARALRAAGYRVLVAADAREALERVEKGPGQPHLVVTDVVMPGMRGPALAAELTSRVPGLRVLYVSGYSLESVTERGLSEAGILAKPFTVPDLLARVRQVLDER